MFAKMLNSCLAYCSAKTDNLGLNAILFEFTPTSLTMTACDGFNLISLCAPIATGSRGNFLLSRNDAETIHSADPPVLWAGELLVGGRAYRSVADTYPEYDKIISGAGGGATDIPGKKLVKLISELNNYCATDKLHVTVSNNRNMVLEAVTPVGLISARAILSCCKSS